MPKDELIDALEKATGADRELDAAIDMVHMNLRGTHIAPTYFDGHDKGNWRDTVGLLRTAPTFTASIDAALTLVPVELANHFLLSISPMSLDMGGRNWKCQVGKHRASAPTPALAICIAALRATERGEAGR